MECAPKNCAILEFSLLTPAEKKAQRKEKAEILYGQGFTEQQIAEAFGVSDVTISKDLRGFEPSSKPPRPKGGRPKGSKGKRKGKKNDTLAAEAAAKLVLDSGMTHEEAGKETGAGSELLVRVAVAREEGRREGSPVDPDSLSMTAQEKLALAIRQHKHKLDLEFEQRVRDEIKTRIDEIVLPHWRQQIEQAKKLYERRKGLMDMETFNTIRRALHPDSRNSISDRKLGEAFDTFMKLEKYLLDEKNSPTEFGNLPSSAAEWDKMRMARKTRRGNNSLQRRA